MGKSSSVSMIGLLIIFVDTCACSITVSVPSLNAVDRRFKSRVIGGVTVSMPSLNAVDRRFKSRCEG